MADSGCKMADGGYRMSVSRTYLVMEPIRVIGEDLAHAIMEFDPGATVIVTMTEDEALLRIAEGAVVGRAVLHSDPAEIELSALGKALANAGTDLIFIGDKVERSGEGVRVLHRPFDNDAVAQVLSQIEDGVV